MAKTQLPNREAMRKIARAVLRPTRIDASGELRRRPIEQAPSGGGGSIVWFKVTTGADSNGVAICKQLNIDGEVIDGTETPVKAYHRQVGSTLYASPVTPRTNVKYGDAWVYWSENIVAGDRPGDVTYLNPLAPTTVGSSTIGDSIEGAEAPDSETYDLTGPLDLFLQSRTAFDHAGDEIFYGYARRERRDSNNMGYRVDEEKQYEVDIPECEEP